MGFFLVAFLGFAVWLALWYRKELHSPPPPTGPTPEEIETLKCVQAYVSAIAAHGVSLIGTQGKDTLKAIDPVPHGYRLVAGEKLLAALDASLIEIVATGRNKSFRSYDNTGYYLREKVEQVTASGKLLVTTKALVFQGDLRSYRWLWSKVSNVDILPWTFKVHLRTGKPFTFSFTEHNLEFAKVLVTQVNL